MPQYALLIDYEFCTGCQSCEVACKEEHGFPVGKWGIRVLDEGPWQKNDEKDEGSCFNWNKIPVPTDLCDFCAERQAKGKLPTCQHHCQAQCLEVGPLDELAEKVKEKRKLVLFHR